MSYLLRAEGELEGGLLVKLAESFAGKSMLILICQDSSESDKNNDLLASI